MPAKASDEAIAQFGPLLRFTRAYLKCALFTSTNKSGEPLDRNHTIDDFTKRTTMRAVADCAEFRRYNDELLAETEATDEQNGHDFWLTRNRHGAGFWDRGYPAQLSKRLTDSAHAFGEQHILPNEDGTLDLI